MSPAEVIDRNITILVVDDQALTRSMLKSILKGLGYGTVIVADNGAMALDKLHEEQIDMVICDWNMPGVTGLDVLKKLRAESATRKTPFIMLTAEAYRENVKAAMEAGVDDYIAKPFTPDILADKVDALLRKSRRAK